LSTSMDLGSPSLSTSMGRGSPSLSTSMGQRSPSLSTSMGLGSPSLSTSMEKGSGISILVYEHGSWISILVYEHGGRSLSSICFLPYRENWSLRINISDKIKSILFADLPFQNVALKRNRTKNHTSLIEKSIDPEMTLLVYERVLIHLSRKSSIPGWDRGRFASL
jgi:hypothetical protein